MLIAPVEELLICVNNSLSEEPEVTIEQACVLIVRPVRGMVVRSRGSLPGGDVRGQQQRVTIATALVNRTEIVWADEPTGNLDSENASEVMGLLMRLNREFDETFVIVTHSDAVAEKLHRTVPIMDSLIVDDGTGRGG